MDELEFKNLKQLDPKKTYVIMNLTKNLEYELTCQFDEHDVPTLQAGGTLNFIRKMQNE